MTLKNKLDKLDEILSGINPMVIAFSGGVDSSFLAHRATGIPGLKFIALTVKTIYMPSREISEAEEFCKLWKINHRVLSLGVPEPVKENPPERCYLCKKTLFSHIIEFATGNGYKYIADGSNADDMNSYRPGLKALHELSVKSPLAEAGLTKDEIRVAASEAGLSVWNKPSMACLLTRLPYNVEVTEKNLKMIDRAENLLFEKGFYGTRVRMHGEIARIECLPGYLDKLVNSPERDTIVKKFKEIGFRYVALDLEGYRSGSMDET